MRIDARIPVRFGPILGVRAGEFPLTPGGGAHQPGCACCRSRSAAGLALAALFQARATGGIPWFTGVVADEADRAAVEEALRNDPVAAARFR